MCQKITSQPHRCTTQIKLSGSHTREDMRVAGEGTFFFFFFRKKKGFTGSRRGRKEGTWVLRMSKIHYVYI